MTGCWSKFDTWMWEDTSEFTREQKYTNYYKARGGEAATKLLAFFRICVVFFWAFSEKNYWDIKETYWLNPLIYLSNWFWYSFALYFVLITFAYIRHEVLGQAVPQDSSSPLQLWKWCQIVYEIQVIMGLWVTLLFWGYVLPAFPEWEIDYNIYAKHAIPLPIIIVEFLTNKIAFE